MYHRVSQYRRNWFGFDYASHNFLYRTTYGRLVVLVRWQRLVKNNRNTERNSIISGWLDWTIQEKRSSLVGIVAGFQISASIHHQVFRFVATAVDVVHLMTDGGAITGAWQIQDLILGAGTALTSATGFAHWNPMILNSTPVAQQNNNIHV